MTGSARATGVLRALRTLLFVPGDQPEKILKATASESDAVIVDLEDAVAPVKKPQARSNLTLLGMTGRPAFVRVNAINTPWFGEDLEAIFNMPEIGVVLPKVSSADECRTYLDILAERALLAGSDQIGSVVFTIETAAGMMNVFEIASVVGESGALAFGGGDYALDLGLAVGDDESELLWARSRLVAAGTAFGVANVFDTIYARFSDEMGFRAACERAHRLGFGGKFLIHPCQIATANEVFDKTADLAWARGIVKIFDDEGIGAVGIDGQLLDYALVYRARMILEAAGEC